MYAARRRIVSSTTAATIQSGAIHANSGAVMRRCDHQSVDADASVLSVAALGTPRIVKYRRCTRVASADAAPAGVLATWVVAPYRKYATPTAAAATPTAVPTDRKK